MSISYRRPNGNGSPANWTGEYNYVDEGYEDRDGNGSTEYILATEKNQFEVHDMQDADWGTGDYVKAIVARISMMTTGSGTDRINIDINGTTTNWVNDDLRSGSVNGDGFGARAYANSYRDLGTNYNATFNGLTLDAEALQQGMAATEGHTITAWDFAVEDFKATPLKGEMAWYQEAGITGSATLTATFVGSHTAKSGNILIAAFANGSSSVPTIQGTGWTLLENDEAPAGSAHKWWVWWKESDGTETGAQITGTTNFSNTSLHVYEIEWSGGTPTLQSNKNVTDEGTDVTTHTTTGITPDNGSDNAVLALFMMENISTWTFGLHLDDTSYQNGYDLYAAWGGVGNTTTIPVTARAFCCAHHRNQSGSQSVTFQTESTGQDAGCPVASCMVVINAVAAGSLPPNPVQRRLANTLLQM
jgi:hypothetical protein